MKDTQTLLVVESDTPPTGAEALRLVSEAAQNAVTMLPDDDPSKPDLIRAAAAATALSALRRAEPLRVVR